MSPMVSTRGYALLLERIPEVGDKPVVTVEVYAKWYDLQVVTPPAKGDEFPFPSIQRVPFPESADISPGAIDHVPNPRVVLQWYEANGYELEEMALEMMIGRWALVDSESEDVWAERCRDVRSELSVIVRLYR